MVSYILYNTDIVSYFPFVFKREVHIMNDKIKLIKMSDVNVEEVKWLLEPFIPVGKITIIQGDPGEGKTTLVLQIIARLTTGRNILDDDNPFIENLEPMNVIYQTAEDGLGDTIKPRLLEAKADCSKVFVIDDGKQMLTMTDGRLEESIIKTSAKLVVLDPIQGFLGANVDMHRANEIRPVMKYLSTIAAKHQCAIVLIGHMNKCSQIKAAYKGLGSIDFAAAARSVLLVGRVKNDPETRVVCQIKSSLAPEAKSIAFRLSKDKGFMWMGEYDITADDLLAGKSKTNKVTEAADFLESVLYDGMKSQKEISDLAEKSEISNATLRRAKDMLSVKAKKVNDQWYWELPK
jgi:archaellum biogenesis ATPase FlaH